MMTNSVFSQFPTGLLLSASAFCPASHPFAYNQGMSCCWSYNRRIDGSNPDLDGSPLRNADPQDYCADNITPELKQGQKLRNSDDDNSGIYCSTE